MTSRAAFSPERLGDRWGCSSQTIRQMYRRGELRGFRLGRLIRIPSSEVERVECQQNTDLSGTEASGASPTELPAVELRLARMIGDGPRLSLVRFGADSSSQNRKG